MTSLYELRRIELERFSADRRSYGVLAISLVPLAIVLSVSAMYVTLSVTLAESDPYYQPERPALGPFLRVATAAILGGIVSIGLVVVAVSEATGASRGVWRLGAIGILFGVLVPFATGLLMPINRFFLNANDVSGAADLSNRVIDAVYGTPLFALTYGVRGIWEGIVVGLLLGGAAWVILEVSHLSSRDRLVLKPYVLSLGLAVFIAAFVFFGPSGLFTFLIDSFAS